MKPKGFRRIKGDYGWGYAHLAFGRFFFLGRFGIFAHYS